MEYMQVNVPSSVCYFLLTIVGNCNGDTVQFDKEIDPKDRLK